MLSLEGRCKTLDAGADGYARSEACSALALGVLGRRRCIVHCSHALGVLGRLRCIVHCSHTLGVLPASGTEGALEEAILICAHGGRANGMQLHVVNSSRCTVHYHTQAVGEISHLGSLFAYYPFVSFGVLRRRRRSLKAPVYTGRSWCLAPDTLSMQLTTRVVLLRICAGLANKVADDVLFDGLGRPDVGPAGLALLHLCCALT